MINYYVRNDVKLFASMAQLAEHSAVNRRVPGSSPGRSVFLMIFKLYNYILNII